MHSLLSGTEVFKALTSYYFPFNMTPLIVCCTYMGRPILKVSTREMCYVSEFETTTYFTVKTNFEIMVLIKSTVNALSVARCCASLAPSVPSCLATFFSSGIVQVHCRRKRVWKLSYTEVAEASCRNSWFTLCISDNCIVLVATLQHQH